MISEVINDWLEEGFSHVKGTSGKQVRRQNSLIPLLTNVNGEILTPRPLFPSFLEEMELDPNFLAVYLEVIEKSLSIDKKSYKAHVSQTEDVSSVTKDPNSESYRTIIQYERKNIFLSRTMFTLFEMPDSLVSKGSPQYNKVLERNVRYKKSIQFRKMSPHNFDDKSVQSEILETIDRETETLPIIFENKSALVNSYLMKEYYERKEIPMKPSPKTFNEFLESRTKFRDCKELMVNLEEYPDILIRFQKALYITEKTLNYNTHHKTIISYNRGILDLETIMNESDEVPAVLSKEKESEDDLTQDEENKSMQEKEDASFIKSHLLFQLEKLKADYQVTCIECSYTNPSLFISGHGVSRFNEMEYDPRGIILLWNIHKCGYPEKIYYTEEIVTCLEFSKSNPYLIAAGMRYGLIAIFDIRKSQNYSTVNNYSSKYRSIGTVKSVRWMKKKYALGKETDVLISVSMDGTITCWNHGRVLDGQILKHIKRGGTSGEEKKVLIAINAASMCMQLKPDNNDIYIVGTVEGQVMEGDFNDMENYIHIYNCHNGPVYDVQWSTLVKDVFMTCGTDRSVHIWEVGKSKPSKTLSLAEYALKLAWSNVKSTLFAALSKTKLFIFDLSINQHRCLTEILAQNSTDLTFVNFCPRNNWFLVGYSHGIINLFEITNIQESNEDQEGALKNSFLSEY